MKKVGIIAVAIVALLLVVVIVVPLVYDVNEKVRPQIIQAIEDNMNAKAELGKLKLSLWGGVFIGVESLRITDSSDSSSVFEMKDAKLQIPLSALLSGKISVILIARGPKLNVVKDKTGKLNLSRLMKTQAEKAKADPAGKNTGTSSSSGADRVLLSTDIEDGELSYRDLSNGSVSKVDQLKLVLKDVGLNHPFDVNVAAAVDIKQAPDTVVKGVVSLGGTVKMSMNESGFEGLDLSSKLDLSDLSIKYGSLFNKESKVPLSVTVDTFVGANEANIKTLDFVVAELKISTTGLVKNFDAPILDVSIKSNKLELSDWKKILEPVRKFDASGSVTMDMKLSGTSQNLGYSGKVDIANVGMRIPGLIPRATDVRAQVLLKNDVVELKQAGMKIGSSDLEMSGQVRDFSAPNVSVALNSKNLNLDEMLGESKPKAKSKDEPEKSSAEQDREAEASAKGPIAQIKSNPTMRKLVFKSQTKIEKLTMSKATMTNVNAQLDFERLVLSLKDAKLSAFGGNVETKLSVDFNGTEPSYKIGGKVRDLDIDAAVTSQYEELKGFVKGKTFADLNLTGSGVAPSKVKANLRGNGNFELKNGEWSGFSPLKALGEKLKSIPQVKEKAAGVVIGNKFRQLKGQFDIRDSKMFLNNLVAELEDVKGGITANGYVAFNKTMHLSGNAIVPISNPPKSLATNDGRAKIPFEVEGDCMNPNPKWEATLGPVGKAFFEDEGKKILKSKVEELVPEGKVKDLIKGFKF